MDILTKILAIAALALAALPAQAPTFPSCPGPIEVDEGDLVNFNVQATVNGQTAVSLSNVGAPAGAMFMPGNPVVGPNANMGISWQTGAGTPYSTIFSFLATNQATGQNAACGVQVKVNHYPFWNQPGQPFIWCVGEAGQIALVADDDDPGQTVAVQAIQKPGWVTLVINGNGPVNVTLNGTPPPGSGGLHAVTLRATDSKGLSKDLMFQIAVVGKPRFLNPPAQPPAPAEPKMFVVGQPGAFDLGYTDDDLPDDVTITAAGLPNGFVVAPPLGTAHAAPATTTFAWTPGPADVGMHEVTFTVTDVLGYTDTIVVTIVVVPAPPPTECFLIIGPIYFGVIGAGADPLFVDPQFITPISLISLQVWQIPADPALIGLQINAQVFLVNPTGFPNDPVKSSNGLQVHIGQGHSTYGQGSGLGLDLHMPAEPGGLFWVDFWME